MQYIPCIVIIILILVIVVETAYIFSIRSNLNHIIAEFAEKMSMDTNTFVTVSTADSYVRRLAVMINKQLCSLRKERLKLEHGDIELKNAVTNIAHDLRTPLTAISGYLEMLGEVTSDEKTARYLDIIRERTGELTKLTEELFRYFAVSSVSDEPDMKSLSLKSELEIAVAGAYGLLNTRHITPELEFAENDVTRVLDHSFLQRIFSNIISNAAKYSEGDLKIMLRDDGCIIFENTASDLTEVEVSQLFDRFYTVNNGKESTGLGLSIARLLTEKMGGNISARLDKGVLSIIMRF